MKVAVRILSLVMLTVHLFCNHCMDCRPFQEDGDKSESAMETRASAAAKVTCGRKLTILGPSEKSSKVFHKNDNENDSTSGNSPIMDRISGGRYVVYGEAPWHANIIYENMSGDINYSCGAAIISEFWLLTAASCFRHKDAVTFYVFVGDHTTNPQDQAEVLYNIRGIFSTRNYTKLQVRLIQYDLALVFISRGFNKSGIKFNQFVQPVCLPTETEDLSTVRTLTVSGIGFTKEDTDESLPRTLKIMTESPVDCVEFRGDTFDQHRVFCFNNTGQSHICTGDSGGAAVHKTGGVYVLYGIVAYDGYPVCHWNRPTHVMNVRAHRDWIIDTINRISYGKQAVIPGRS